MKIKYQCTCCDAGEHEFTLEQHTNPNVYMECECGEKMEPVNREYIQELESRLAGTLLSLNSETLGAEQ